MSTTQTIGLAMVVSAFVILCVVEAGSIYIGCKRGEKTCQFGVWEAGFYCPGFGLLEFSWREWFGVIISMKVVLVSCFVLCLLQKKACLNLETKMCCGVLSSSKLISTLPGWAENLAQIRRPSAGWPSAAVTALQVWKPSSPTHPTCKCSRRRLNMNHYSVLVLSVTPSTCSRASINSSLLSSFFQPEFPCFRLIHQGCVLMLTNTLFQQFEFLINHARCQHTLSIDN